MGYSQHSGVVIVADGSVAADARLGRCHFGMIRGRGLCGMRMRATTSLSNVREEKGLDLPMV